MKILGAGDNTADRYVDVGLLYPGGNALNVAVFAKRAGAEAGYMGVLGNDSAGLHIRSVLENEGIDTSLTRVVDGPNATADVALRGNDRVFLGSDRSTALFSLDTEQLEAMSAFDAVHSGYAGTLLPRVQEISQKTRVSFDFGSNFEFDRHIDAFQHLFLASFSGSHLSKSRCLEVLKRAVAAGATNVLVTRGEQGALFANNAGVYEQEAERVDVRDTLGAGDAFIAGVLTGLVANRDIPKILATASMYAGEVCQLDGAFGYPMRFSSLSIPTVSSVQDKETRGTA